MASEEERKGIHSRIKGIAHRSFHTVRSSAVNLKSEIKKNVLTAVLAAFGFVIALVWRDAIRAGVDEIIQRSGMEGTGYIYQIVSAVIVTIICVIGILFFSRIKGEEDVKDCEKK
ncbi:MAG: DUF5654 family protein [Candidatus Woesearchaeota archaeon]|jgi:CDP-diglyceride synthetase|nr:DUF5654 family protein [Candidatus Woesearchaeota archaeon]MDP7506737.1 DUF5654 family protein [Candidatus Woesearchaeota archaeon]MDP7610484.1 DUF5654 family protein [Candidatus Woesearchaeota archaeon]|tara:strand:+ start:1970 stop:2314 length:345 start_codon:yes stop_codon:yes gene_type:complete